MRTRWRSTSKEENKATTKRIAPTRNMSSSTSTRSEDKNLLLLASSIAVGYYLLGTFGMTTSIGIYVSIPPYAYKSKSEKASSCRCSCVVVQ
jgi:hypothetical protein